MSLPSISIIKFSPQLSDQAVQDAIRAVNRQIVEDFVPIWGNGRTLRLHAPSFNIEDPNALTEEPIRGESVIYLVDEATLPGALGYHDLNSRAIPVGFVFVLDPQDWTTTLSHEVLELIIDPTVNLFAPGPDPRNPANLVLHTYEVCDAVERISYEIDGIQVSDFLTPSYFTAGDEIGTRNDFLGVGVSSFGVTQGSHIAFFDLATGTFETVFGQKAPALAIQSERLRAHDHPKPERPSDDKLEKVLANYRSNIQKNKLYPKCTGLPQLQSITRTGRYRQNAQRLVLKGVAKTRG
jgi:hypothetical protein